MDKTKKDNVYVYIWEGLNTIYVGRTKNPKSRHYQHKHRENERTYKFSSEHHVEHPKMIIIETDLTVEEGVEREKYWINEYRKNKQYNVLNKSCGGQVGKLSKLTEEEKKEHQRKYYQSNKNSKIEYQKKYRKTHKNYDKEQSKIWYEKHKEEKKEYQKKYDRLYYMNNKDKIIARVKKYNENKGKK